MQNQSNLLPTPQPTTLSAIRPGERFSPVHMPYAVLSLLTVYGSDAHDTNNRWTVVIDVADDARNIMHGQLMKLQNSARVYRVEQGQRATYRRCCA